VRVIDLLIEGAAALRFGCTFALALLGVPLVFLGRKWMATSMVIFWLVSILVGWARFVDLWPGAPVGAGLIPFGVAIIALTGFGWWRPTIWSVSGLAVGLAVIAGWLWVPCVGVHLSEPLNDALAGDRAGTVVPLLAYGIGVCVPLFAAAALAAAVPKFGALVQRDRAAWVGAALSLVLAVSISAGWYSEFVSRFRG